jgi:transcription-repair coupling factor (superfamily II helicase)
MVVMTFFNPIISKLSLWEQSSNQRLLLTGIEEEHWPFLFQQFLLSHQTSFANKNQLIVTPSVSSAERIYQGLKSKIENGEAAHQIYLYPGLDASPYHSILPSIQDLYTRFRTLDQLLYCQEQDGLHLVVIATHESLLLKGPPPNFFADQRFSIHPDDIIEPLELASRLVELGYTSNITVEEPGTFSRKGEIFDLYPISSGPVRINYFDEMIEAIHPINPTTGKSDRSTPLKGVDISVSPGVLVDNLYSTILRNNIPMPSPGEKERYKKRIDLFESFSRGELPHDYVRYLPLFFEPESTSTLLDYFSPKNTIISMVGFDQIIQRDLEWREELRVDFETESENQQGEILLPSPEYIYRDSLEHATANFCQILVNHPGCTINHHLDYDFKHRIDLDLKPVNSYLAAHVNPAQERFSYVHGVLTFIKSKFEQSGTVVLATHSQHSKQELEYLIEGQNFSSSLTRRVHFIDATTESGFYYPSEDLLLLTDRDLFGRKKSHAVKKMAPNLDLFAEQLSMIKEGDFVIHNDLGIGKYLGLESMNIGGTSADYLVLEYTENDKIYVPVYRMDMVQRYADGDSNHRVASLRKNRFNQLKERAKGAAKKLAFDLLQLQAARKSSEAYAFSPPDHHYQEFTLAFPFVETADQLTAAEQVVESMQESKPMDHLVCGDVGFGKTEVAMRAAFKAVLDKKQVAILVPTTILALQHYNSFLSRFKDFPVNIEFLSRFKTTSEAKEIRERLAKGEIDIVIGTHKLLAKNIEYLDLGLVVVDEEHRFGVAHKERLKLLKCSVDFLTLTATPIPRTLQLAFLGLKDLSIIQTAPPRRQSIKSYLIQEDDNTIKQAVDKELARGGQVFYVHNRVQDMDSVYDWLKTLVPQAKIVVAHGQMAEKDLEKRVQSFYQGENNILLSTTIIESGIDIPTANTMIINRADRMGLAQLHQLRGRIGRSDRKAYAYFVVPKNRSLTPLASKRLAALQTYADMGSGFNIASSDLEIRGAGDILGASQSGHIEAVGLELYMDLLKDAINELKGEEKIIRTNVEISTPFPSNIPHHYISDAPERLKTYKKLANCHQQKQLDQYRDELLDIFGAFPPEVENFFLLLATKVSLQPLGVISVKVVGSIITLQFDRNIVKQNTQLRDRIVTTFMARPKIFQLTPDYKVIFSGKSTITQEFLLEFSKNIAEQIHTC